MPSVEELQAEHRLIRHTLSAFQEVLVHSQASEMAQDVHQAVIELLEAHLRKEEQATAPYENRIQAVLRADRLCDHAEPRVVLRDIERLFSAWRYVPMGLLAIHLTRLIDELRECFDEEERWVFPIVQCAQRSVEGVLPLADLARATDEGMGFRDWRGAEHRVTEIVEAIAAIREGAD